jgi:hypothetical protein
MSMTSSPLSSGIKYKSSVRDLPPPESPRSRGFSSNFPSFPDFDESSPRTYGAILVDLPWRFQTRSPKGQGAITRPGITRPARSGIKDSQITRTV